MKLCAQLLHFIKQFQCQRYPGEIDTEVVLQAFRRADAMQSDTRKDPVGAVDTGGLDNTLVDQFGDELGMYGTSIAELAQAKAFLILDDNAGEYVGSLCHVG